MLVMPRDSAQPVLCMRAAATPACIRPSPPPRRRHRVVPGVQPRPGRHAGGGQLCGRCRAAGQPLQGAAVPAGGGACRRHHPREAWVADERPRLAAGCGRGRGCSEAAALSVLLHPARRHGAGRPLARAWLLGVAGAGGRLGRPSTSAPPFGVCPGWLQVCFSACGNYLYTGARKDSALLCWDVRYSSGGWVGVLLVGLLYSSGWVRGPALQAVASCRACHAPGSADESAGRRKRRQLQQVKGRFIATAALRRPGTAPNPPRSSFHLFPSLITSRPLQACCTRCDGTPPAPTSACTLMWSRAGATWRQVGQLPCLLPFREAPAQPPAVLRQGGPADAMPLPSLPILLPAGGEDGCVQVFDLRDGSLATRFQAAADTGGAGRGRAEGCAG